MVSKKIMILIFEVTVHPLYTQYIIQLLHYFSYFSPLCCNLYLIPKYMIIYRQQNYSYIKKRGEGKNLADFCFRDYIGGYINVTVELYLQYHYIIFFSEEKIRETKYITTSSSQVLTTCESSEVKATGLIGSIGLQE